MIDPGGAQPVYLQVAALMRERIESGEWPPNRRLPSETALMHEFGVARNTVHKAIVHLRGLGLVYTVRNWGSVVKAGAEYVAVVTMQPGGRAIIREATSLELVRFDLPEGSPVVVIEGPNDSVEVYPAYTVEIRTPEM